jgi:hypothetical protein
MPIRMVNGKEYEIVECITFVTSLDSNPTYQALSYTWGSKTKSNLHDISLDGQIFKVTLNLRRALWQLQSTSEKTFWIDALCINQNDNRERSEQVSKMRTIYQQAENVVVWLGQRSNSTSLVFNLFEDLYENRGSKQYYINFLGDKENVKGFAGLISHFERDYWFRVWVIQEVNSAREITIMCGKYEISWSKVEEVQNIMARHYVEQLSIIAHTEPNLDRFAQIVEHRGARKLRAARLGSPNRLPDLHSLLCTFWAFDATDPRDKVFALIGLSSARDDSRLVIDYSSSVRRTYINVATYILDSSKKLDFICSIPHGANPFHLPSWVPDWTVTSELSISLSTFIKAWIHDGEDSFNAAGGSSPVAEFRQDSQILAAKGISLGYIEYIGKKGSFKSRYDFKAGIPILLNWYRLWNVMSASNAIAQFCTIIFWGRFSFGGISQFSTKELMQRILAAIATLAEEFCPDEMVPPDLIVLRETFRMELWRARSWICRSTELVRGRQFFISKSGLAGMCPNSVESGDIICILLGCFVPVVLRPQPGGHYILLGDAYFYDYMFGMGMEELADGKFQLESFEIH